MRIKPPSKESTPLRAYCLQIPVSNRAALCWIAAELSIHPIPLLLFRPSARPAEILSLSLDRLGAQIIEGTLALQKHT